MLDTYLHSLLGGLLIAFSSSLILLFLGRITGISGILAPLFKFSMKNDKKWRAFFVLGLILGTLLLTQSNPELFRYHINSSPIRLIIAGLLVGFGTRLGSGCTSGHGVCGLPRLSQRSLLAVFSFIFFGILTVSIERWLL